jgi:hypothetical protein
MHEQYRFADKRNTIALCAFSTICISGALGYRYAGLQAGFQVRLFVAPALLSKLIYITV